MIFISIIFFIFYPFFLSLIRSFHFKKRTFDIIKSYQIIVDLFNFLIV